MSFRKWSFILKFINVSNTRPPNTEALLFLCAVRVVCWKAWDNALWKTLGKPWVILSENLCHSILTWYNTVNSFSIIGNPRSGSWSDVHAELQLNMRGPFLVSFVWVLKVQFKYEMWSQHCKTISSCYWFWVKLALRVICSTVSSIRDV